MYSKYMTCMYLKYVNLCSSISIIYFQIFSLTNFVKPMQSIPTTLGMLSKVIITYRENKGQLVRGHYSIVVQNIGMIYQIPSNHHIIYMHLPNC